MCQEIRFTCMFTSVNFFLVLYYDARWLEEGTMTGDTWTQRSSLPIFSAREALIREFKQNDSCVVVGETGSGKTTQIPQVYINWCKNHVAAVTSDVSVSIFLRVD